MKTIGVIGAGQMGNVIAHVAAQAGLSVVMRDLEDEGKEKGIAALCLGGGNAVAMAVRRV